MTRLPTAASRGGAWHVSGAERSRALGGELALAVDGAPHTLDQTEALLALCLQDVMVEASDNDREYLARAFREGFLEHALRGVPDDDVVRREQLVTIAMTDVQHAGRHGVDAALALGERASVAFVLTDADGAVRKMTSAFGDFVGVTDANQAGWSLHDWLRDPAGGPFDIVALVDHARGLPDAAIRPALLRNADGGSDEVAISSVVIDEADVDEGSTLILSTVRPNVMRNGTSLALPDRVTFDDVFRNAYDVTVVIDNDDIVRYASPGVGRLIGSENGYIFGRVFSSILMPDNRELYVSLRQELSAAPDVPVRGEAWLHQVDGSQRRAEFVAHCIGNGTCSIGVVIHARDISERQAYQERLERMAMLDSLTALPNRAMFMEQLGAALFQAEAGGDDVAVLFIDLDQFKHINDRKGHGVGDQALVDIGRRIAGVLKPEDLVARLGGDEFAALITSASSDAALATATRVQEALQQPLTSGHSVFRLTASIGVASSAPGLRHTEALLEAADIALYRAKSHGGAEITLFDAAMRDHAEVTRRAIDDLRVADSETVVSLAFQPEYDAHSGALTSLVATPSWDRLGSEREELDLALLEEHDPALATAITMRVLRAAAEQFQAWAPHLSDSVMLSVRLGLGLVRSEQHMAELQREISEVGLPLGRLQPRIHADVFNGRGNHVERDVAVVRRLTEAYVLDGVGIEHASIPILRQLEHSRIGIDVSRLGPCEVEHMLFADMLAQSSRRLGISIMATGIETAHHADIAGHLECMTMSGPYLVPALPANEAQSRIEEGSLLSIRLEP